MQTVQFQSINPATPLLQGTIQSASKREADWLGVPPASSAKGRKQGCHAPPRPGRPWEFVPRWRDVSGKDGEALSLFPSFIKLFPDLSGLGPSSQEISAHHWGVCTPSPHLKVCALPPAPLPHLPLPGQFHSDSLCLSDQGPFCSIFPLLSLSKK